MTKLASAGLCSWAWAVVSLPLLAQSPQTAGDPDAAQLITSDVERFWAAVDQATPDDLPDGLQREYIDRGTEGLAGFISGRIVSAEALASQFLERRARYEEARENSLRLTTAERAIRAPFYALEYLYPNAVFPNVYFVIGRLNSGGTISERGLLIGAEMYRDADGLPSIVAHELIHYQQPPLPDSARTLLAQSLREGSADFMAELISGKHLNATAHEFGRAHEKELWAEFQDRMRGRDLVGWLYGDPPGERPADLGYFIGYRIAEAYYLSASNKRQAVSDILTIRNPEEFLSRSGYNP